MYNRNGSGTRYNFGEQALTKDNVANLVEKWLFPPVDSKEKIGIRTLAIEDQAILVSRKEPLTPAGPRR